jgi:NAD(P)-dependent dehydrogenase (short-subunit alcohol dehydrogenase family)
LGQLDGQTAVVTGCSSGIGEAITLRFLEEGAVVVGLDLNEFVAPIDRERFVMRIGSVAQEADITAAIDQAVEDTGRIDIMVNNAALQLEQTIDDTSVEQFDQLVATNLRGVFIGIKMAAAKMSTGGRIINLGSVLGFTGDPLLAAYTATKGGVVNLTRSAALTYGRRGIRVNSLCPGAVRTSLTTRVWDLADDPQKAREDMESLYPLGRIAEPSEIASAALFLATEASSAMTGASLMVDCGLTAANPEYSLVKDLL